MAIGCDTSYYMTKNRLDALKSNKYTFVGRYIDYLQGAHNNLTVDEALLISDADIDIVSLYQPKGMNTAEHYTANQALIDVVEALKLARNLKQPSGSAIYFCVDFDATESVIENNITPYFNNVFAAFVDHEGNPEGYKLGVYGSGLVCSTVSNNRYTVHTMLACAAKWAGSSEYTAWNIKQSVPIILGAGYSWKFDVDPCESSSRGTGGWRL